MRQQVAGKISGVRGVVVCHLSLPRETTPHTVLLYSLLLLAWCRYRSHLQKLISTRSLTSFMMERRAAEAGTADVSVISLLSVILNCLFFRWWLLPPMEANLSLGSVKDYSNTHHVTLIPPPPFLPCSEPIRMSGSSMLCTFVCRYMESTVCQKSLSLTLMDGLGEMKGVSLCVCASSCVWGLGVVLWIRNSKSWTHPGTCHTFRHPSPSNPKILLLHPASPTSRPQPRRSLHHQQAQLGAQWGGGGSRNMRIQRDLVGLYKLDTYCLIHFPKPEQNKWRKQERLGCKCGVSLDMEISSSLNMRYMRGPRL